MFLSFTRVAKLALQQFHRNLWLSIVTITLLVLPLLAVNVSVGLGVIARSARDAVQDKIDVSVYFKPVVSNETAESIKQELLKLSEVKDVNYIPREGSLERFKERHKNDPVIMESLQELGDNPFGATLAIKARDPEQYGRILSFLEDPKYTELIEEKNFEDHRLVIDKINTLLRSVRAFGMAVAGIFGIIAVLIVINAVRVAVYTHRGEIGVMRLVGASNSFIRGPFLLESVIFSALAIIITAGIVYLGLYFAQPYFNNFFGDMRVSIIAYYNANILRIFGTQFLGILLLTMVSSFLAVRRYLRV